MRRNALKSACSSVALALGVMAAGNATAVPLLQLYAEGATYDPVNESWDIPGNSFTLWAIANLTGPGGTGGLAITNVRLAVVYDNNGPVSITLTPTVVGGLPPPGSYAPPLPYSGPPFTDPSVPSQPVATLIAPPVIDGSTPLVGGTKYLPSHGEYGPGRAWQEFALGDFDMPDSPLGDFINNFPLPSATNQAQINAYLVSVTPGTVAHFDLYGQVAGNNGRVSYVFAPFSHDATDGPERVPLPATLSLLGIGALGLRLSRRKKPIR